MFAASMHVRPTTSRFTSYYRHAVISLPLRAQNQFRHKEVLQQSHFLAMASQVQNPQLRLRNALQSGSKPIMTFIGLPSFRTAQVIAQTGVDAVIIDCEHGCISDDSMHSATAAIAAFGVSPLVRLRMTHVDLVKRALDAGAHGIVVPQVNTAEEARSVVSYAKFPPLGIRGQGSQFPGIAHGIDTPSYLRTANDTLITCIQIETRAGVENVDAICSIPGVDMIFIGPNDLAMSLFGYAPAKGDEPEFLDAIEKIVAAARRHGKWISRLSDNGVLAKQHLEIFDTVALSYDVRAILNWYGQELRVARS